MNAANENWRTRLLISGAVVGALIGVATAFLLARAAEEHGQGPPQIKTMDAIRVAAGVVGTVRGIAALGRP